MKKRLLFSVLFLCVCSIASADKRISGSLSISKALTVSTDNLVVTEGGNVGIGTTDPGEMLEIAGNGHKFILTDSEDSNNERATLGHSEDNGGYLLLESDNGADNVLIRGYSLGGVQAYFNAGNVGIGTTDPGAKLDVAGNVSVVGSLSVGSLITPYKNTITVAKSGGDFTTIQDALTANTSGNELFLIYPGTYTNDTITFTANNQCVKNAGRPNTTFITNSAQVVEAGDFTNCAISGMDIQFNPTTAINGIEVNDGSLTIFQSKLTLTTSTAIAGATQPALLATTGVGQLKTKLGEQYYYHTGNTTNGLKTMLNVSTGGKITLLRPCRTIMTNLGTAAATTLYIDAGTGEIDVENACAIEITDTVAAVVAGFGYIGGSGDDVVSYSTMKVTGGGSNDCYAIYHGGTGILRTSHNNINVTGGANNYGAFVGASATLNGHMDDIRAADGNIVNGTANIASSESDGSFTVSGDLTVVGNIINTEIQANTTARHDAVTVTDTAEIDLTLTLQDIQADINVASIDEGKLDVSVNASLDLADSALQAEVDGSVTNEINTIQGDDNTPTSGLAISIDGAGIVTTDVIGDVLTVTGTEADTLATVTGRGATTTTAVTMTNLTTIGDLSIAENLSPSASTVGYAVLMDVSGDIIGRTGLQYPFSGGEGAGYTNLTEFVDQTAWRVFYSNTDGDVTELALGADGTYLKSNGASSAPTFDTVVAGEWDDHGNYLIPKDALEDVQIDGALTVDGNLSVDGDLSVGGTYFLTGDIEASDGSNVEVAGNVTAASYYGDGSNLTGITAGAWTEAGADVYRATGNVGIGTTSPTAKLQVDGDINTVGWTDYYSSSTIVGWSSSTGTIYYKKVGKLVFVNFQITGTSNTTAATFTLPYTRSASGSQLRFPISGADNSVDLTQPAMGLLNANQSTVYTYPDWASGGWTASNAKVITGEFWYEATT